MTNLCLELCSYFYKKEWVIYMMKYLKKVLLLCSLCMMFCLNGCAYYHNTSWEDLSREEQSELYQAYRETKDTMDTSLSSLPAKKAIRIEVLSAQDKTLLATITDQDFIDELSGSYDWTFQETITEELVPEYTLAVYQEKTRLLGQDADEEVEFECIETWTIYKDSPYIQMTISSDVVKNSLFSYISQDILTFYYVMPDDFLDHVKNQIS